MQKYVVLRSTRPTSDGLYLYNFQQIPQAGYIKVHNLFGKADAKMLKKASAMLAAAGLLPAVVEIQTV